MNLSTVIIEDEEQCTETLMLLLNKYCSGITISATASTVEEGVQKIAETDPDIIFLDVEILGGNGFQVLSQLGNIRSKVIMTTAHERYAVTAFKFPVIDYLLKPVNKDDLVHAVTKCRQQIGIESKNANQNSFVSSTNKIAIALNGEIKFINCDEIIQCKASGSYTDLFLTSGKTVTAIKPLKEVENRLPDYFYRVHHSFIVNLNYIASVSKTDNLITMVDHSVVELSVRKKTEFYERLKVL
jgi:two-component system, LytTR family, response regulator